MMKKVDDTVKSVAGDNSSKKKPVKKGRPTCKRDEEEERRMQSQALLTNPSLKFIGMQIEKLENMHVVLTAEEGMSKLAYYLHVIRLGKANGRVRKRVPESERGREESQGEIELASGSH